MEKRTFPRLYYHYLVNYRILEHFFPRTGICVTENLSLGGLLVELDDYVPPGAILEIDIATKDSIISAKTEVRHVRTSETQKFDVGMAFLEISEEDVEKLKLLFNE